MRRGRSSCRQACDPVSNRFPHYIPCGAMCGCTVRVCVLWISMSKLAEHLKSIFWSHDSLLFLESSWRIWRSGYLRQPPDKTEGKERRLTLSTATGMHHSLQGYRGGPMCILGKWDQPLYPSIEEILPDHASTRGPDQKAISYHLLPRCVTICSSLDVAVDPLRDFPLGGSVPHDRHDVASLPNHAGTRQRWHG